MKANVRFVEEYDYEIFDTIRDERDIEKLSPISLKAEIKKIIEEIISEIEGDATNNIPIIRDLIYDFLDELDEDEIASDIFTYIKNQTQ
ncbi:hypothetical protein [Ignavigranum ruoffiae]|uniref:hypothetical protein n=1 Tax=Ignavigranum ruoffiae TaxID=89093 RepID=UPI0023554BC6|nr:hypothetical protein [Ignavigranum ruoffiae]